MSPLISVNVIPTEGALSGVNDSLIDVVTEAANKTGGGNHGTMSKIFLQTAAAQGISGFFAFAALVITCHQVSPTFLKALPTICMVNSVVLIVSSGLDGWM